MILVLGGGFGLYGHMAALSSMQCDIAAPARYRRPLLARQELAMLDTSIRWVDDEAEAMRSADQIILARRPQDNAALAERLIEGGFRGGLVIEKPIAPTPAAARHLEERLLAARLPWATPYLFLHCDWTDRVRQAIGRLSGAVVEIDWAFRQSPNTRDWKRQSGEGGGNLAFYFIHCIALAESLLPKAEYGGTPLRDAGGAKLELSAHGGGSHLTIRFDQTGGDTGFTVRIDGQPVANAPTPFGGIPAPGLPDPRITVLQRFYRETVFSGAFQNPEFHRAVNDRWAEIAAVDSGSML